MKMEEIKLDAGEWYQEKDNAQKEYDIARISRKVYEVRTRFAIGMIYKCGGIDDKEVAERMAKAHGYDIDELIKEVS